MKHLIAGRGGGQRSALAENCQRRILVRYHYPAMSGSSGGAGPCLIQAAPAVLDKSFYDWHCNGLKPPPLADISRSKTHTRATRRVFPGFTSCCRAAGDRRRQQGRAARALQPACQGCARGCAGEALDILQGCAEPRLRPEALIADRS